MPGRRTGSAHTSPPSSTIASTARTSCARRLAPSSVLDAQFFTGHRAVAQLARGGLEDDHALFHDVAAIAHAECDACILLDEQHGYAEALELPHHVPDVADERRGELLRGLVHEDQPRAGHHYARD